MRLSVLEIKKKEFQQKMRGFEPEEVQAFLAQVSEEVELLTCEREEAVQKRMDAEAQLGHYLNLEQTLERTLVAAQQTAMKLEEQAKREAELILKEADLERERKLADVRREFDRTSGDLLHLRAEYETTLARLRSVLDGFSRFVQSIGEDRSVPGSAVETSMLPSRTD